MMVLDEQVGRTVALLGLTLFSSTLPDVTVMQPGGVDPLAASGVTALALAIALLGLFIRGDIVPRVIYDKQVEANSEMRRTVDNLTAAIDGRTKIDAARLEWEREQSLRRSRRSGEND